MKFYGRTQEKKKLQSMFDSNQQNVTLIYGRRRVGKDDNLILINLNEIYR